MLVDWKCSLAQLGGKITVRQLACLGVTEFRQAIKWTNSSTYLSGRQIFQARRKTNWSNSTDSVRLVRPLRSFSVAVLAFLPGLQLFIALGNHLNTSRKVITSSLLKTGSRTTCTSFLSSSLLLSLIYTLATKRNRSPAQLSRQSIHQRSSPSLERVAKGVVSKSQRELRVSRLFWMGMEILVWLRQGIGLLLRAGWGIVDVASVAVTEAFFSLLYEYPI